MRGCFCQLDCLLRQCIGQKKDQPAVEVWGGGLRDVLVVHSQASLVLQAWRVFLNKELRNGERAFQAAIDDGCRCRAPWYVYHSGRGPGGTPQVEVYAPTGEVRST